jgi:hypothetical protein
MKEAKIQWIKSIVTDDVVTIDILGNICDKKYRIFSAAKRNKVDKYDKNIGIELALGRAFERLGKKLKRMAYKRLSFITKKSS